MTMLVNLLPAEALHGYVRRRRLTILTRLVAALGFVFLMLAVFVGSSWVYLVILKGAEAQRFTVVKRSEEVTRAERFERELSGLSAELIVLRDLDKPQYDPALLVRDIANVMPPGVRLATISIKLSQDEKEPKKTDAVKGQSLFLTGEANTRADILNFQNALGNLSFVEGIEAPLENIIKPVQSTFSFEIKLKHLAEKTANGEQVEGDLHESDMTEVNTSTHEN